MKQNLNNKIGDIINIYLKIYWNRISNRGEKNLYNIYFNREIKRVLYNKYLENINIDKRDISVVYDCIINDLNSEIDKRIRNSNINELMAILYGIACFQAEFHGRVFITLNNNTSNFSNILHIEKDILRYIERNLKKRFIVDSISATDKSSIQYLIEKCMHFSSDSDNQNNFGVKLFTDVYMMSLIITNLIAEKNMLLSGLCDDISVWINDYMIYNNLDRYYDNEIIYKEYIEDLNFDIRDYDSKIIEKLKNNFFKSYGFRIETIERFLNSTNKTIKDTELVHLVEEKTLVKAFCDDSGADIEEIRFLIKYLTITKSIEYDKLKSMENYSNRILEKAFININNCNISIYMFSYIILLHSYEILIRKLVYNLLPKCKKINSKIIEREIKNNLVIDCSNILKKYTNKIIINAHKVYINNEKIITLSNEIDLIAVVTKKLFIIECKDIYYKFTPYGFKCDINKTYSFISKMEKKYKSVLENKQNLEIKFGCEIEEIQPIIVFKTYNMAINSKLNNNRIKIINFNGLEKLIRDTKN
ncbi:hypothetical protein ACE5LJ_16560 [Clostridioides difficile]|uniref:hypothetical protein n=1 Tax=Clostridioides difficile TaxID=1496 RepID=UPI001182FE43|nr:hypothetical protein [Clostridioides difficile]HBE8148576.1 hypothetical protein [Clostridioides difficile]